jgi:hypothetical protein
MKRLLLLFLLLPLLLPAQVAIDDYTQFLTASFKLPANNAGYLYNSGTAFSWKTPVATDFLPAYVNGQYLTNNGTTLSWAAIDTTSLVARDGTRTLTADWNVGAFDLTCVDMNATRLLVGDGTVGAPAIAPTSDTHTGIAFDGGDNIYLVSAGISAMQCYGANVFGMGMIRSALNLESTAQKITAGTGTGLTVDASGHVIQQVYKVTVTYAGFSAAALTADKVIATLPAKTRLVGMYADTTTPFTGGGVTAATLMVGKSAGAAEYIAVHDVLSGAVTKGLADADMGTELVAAARIQGGAIVNWTGTTAITARLTATTANTNALTAGSVTFYLITERL